LSVETAALLFHPMRSFSGEYEDHLIGSRKGAAD
jgi:hypothetical protein